MTYAFPPGGLPGQHVMPDGKAVFTTAYAFIPANTMRDIVTSVLPGWTDTRAWIIARPMTGFAETFAQYAVEVAPGGGSDAPEPDAGAEAGIFIATGEMTLVIDGTAHMLTAGGYAYVPPSAVWSVKNNAAEPLQFHWVRKRWQPAVGVTEPDAIITSDADTPPTPMPDTGKWATTRFADPDDLRHDMHVNIVTFEQGGLIPFAETHIMEHGLYVLQGTARYLLNTDWVEVGPGDFMWLRAYCPQACVATSDEPFRYLLYKDVNRHPDLVLK
ncbi:bifunctional allantoicase/(S)-ureidoglycine aminohydrolase [Thalassobium sp. R2A62]|jgi:(S)-ureidoglycine aminohydrolase|uniref:bifunctional allantoicase/(S)-ureidoglycine aminohydrolase n=1 Tax=Thalassobium sp. R2A62 TaxID=633131 RepID=UPI0001B1D6E1|nr:bifunctional allantoicase/(S)-ureidoglycine aminohydrolase [Thalassobium sp. R2A62]EET48694.1 putative allantoin catabolism protein [Thalassobium sp. R2A62]MDG1341276.1 bifunctional allantoicase/(S)-ureidoglycine aminohydrolase [Paracoccaceae bacterium]MDG2451531.1 bifunctional allantoicase/(S)-ureidoglycine aminohydrolase [Paracoccaceae bacterium]